MVGTFPYDKQIGWTIREFGPLPIPKRFPCLAPLRAYVKAWNTKIIPIFLTVASTVLGFIPFMVGKGGILVSVGGRHYWRVDNVSGRSVCFYQLFPALLLLISISTLCLYKFAPSAMFFPASAVPIPYITMGVCHTMPEWIALP